MLNYKKTSKSSSLYRNGEKETLYVVIIVSIVDEFYTFDLMERIYLRQN